MRNNKRSAPFSNLSVRLKFLLLSFLLVAAVFIVWAAMLRTVSSTQKDKYKKMERTIITATEQMMNLAVESSVSIAKTIYTNEYLYDFLNQSYASASEYYEAYYPLQQNTVISMADTNIIKKTVIYTENPTVLTGGNMKKLDSVKDSYWYKNFKKLNKPLILCIDPDTNAMILVRRLDYMNLKTGESYLCLELDMDSLIANFNNLGFDGALYIMSGGSLIYSFDPDIKTVEEITISPDFDCVTRNYYTVDIEYYSCTRKNTMMDFVLGNKSLLITLAAVFVISLFIGQLMASGIKRRVRSASDEFARTGSTSALGRGENGRDEIGALLDICSDMSERLALKGDEYQVSSDSLIKKSSEYNFLYSTAMRLDAEMTVMERYPDIADESAENEVSLKKETELILRAAESTGASVTADPNTLPDIMVPVYSVLLIADDIFRNYSNASLSVVSDGDDAVFTFTSSDTPKSSDILKIDAIFEEETVSDEYSFDRKDKYNSYLRIRHCLGRRAEMRSAGKSELKIILKIINQKEA